MRWRAIVTNNRNRRHITGILLFHSHSALNVSDHLYCCMWRLRRDRTCKPHFMRSLFSASRVYHFSSDAPLNSQPPMSSTVGSRLTAVCQPSFCHAHWCLRYGWPVDRNPVTSSSYMRPPTIHWTCLNQYTCCWFSSMWILKEKANAPWHMCLLVLFQLINFVYINFIPVP